MQKTYCEEFATKAGESSALEPVALRARALAHFVQEHQLFLRALATSRRVRLERRDRNVQVTDSVRDLRFERRQLVEMRREQTERICSAHQMPNRAVNRRRTLKKMVTS